MAIFDVKKYYYNMLGQYIEMKNDLADFEEALKDGHITEDQLASVKEDIVQVENNFQRLAYIMYLLELPNRKNKKEKYIKSQVILKEFFETLGCDQSAVMKENECITAHLKAELEKLKNLK